MQLLAISRELERENSPGELGGKELFPIQVDMDTFPIPLLRLLNILQSIDLVY